MRLLIVTQKVDKNDDILGFFHRWILEFAKHYEFVTVIALQVGEYDLPDNVKVLSLGKEEGVSKVGYIFNFYRYIWSERKSYDAVFVHMNQEYILLGWKLWKLWGKRIFLWRNHAKGNFLTRLSVFFSNKVFCTSKQSFTARFKKTKIMPVGIDTDFFKSDSSINKKPNSILFLGRLDPVKNVDVFIEALRRLKGAGVEFSATIAGNASSKNIGYEKVIRDKVLTYGLWGMVAFTGAVTQIGALKLYREHELYVNLTQSGSMDKTIFEAMASSMTPLVHNAGLKESLGQELILIKLNADYIADKLSQVLREKKDKNFRDLIVEEHSLKKLIDNLLKEIK
mgnify:FL=1